MAEIVAAVGVPHTPAFPGLVAREGRDSETGKLYAQVREHLESTGAELLVMFDADHLNTFFFDNLPALSVPIAAEAPGTNDATPGMHNRSVQLAPSLGEEVLAGLTSKGYFPSRNAKLSMDHSVMVPMHFLDPGERMTLLPIYLNGLVPPLPSAFLPGGRRPAYRRQRDCRRPRPGVGHACHPTPAGRADRRARRGGDHSADAAGRQRRRGAAELDRRARCRREPDAGCARAAGAPRPFVRRVDVELR
jgi:hypothetical protein